MSQIYRFRDGAKKYNTLVKLCTLVMVGLVAAMYNSITIPVNEAGNVPEYAIYYIYAAAAILGYVCVYVFTCYWLYRYYIEGVPVNNVIGYFAFSLIFCFQPLLIPYMHNLDALMSHLPQIGILFSLALISSWALFYFVHKPLYEKDKMETLKEALRTKHKKALEANHYIIAAGHLAECESLLKNALNGADTKQMKKVIDQFDRLITIGTNYQNATQNIDKVLNTEFAVKKA